MCSIEITGCFIATGDVSIRWAVETPIKYFQVFPSLLVGLMPLILLPVVIDVGCVLSVYNSSILQSVIRVLHGSRFSVVCAYSFSDTGTITESFEQPPGRP
jgi:hypothetical protein